jgi:hypothetical protein
MPLPNSGAHPPPVASCVHFFYCWRIYKLQQIVVIPIILAAVRNMCCSGGSVFHVGLMTGFPSCLWHGGLFRDSRNYSFNDLEAPRIDIIAQGQSLGLVNLHQLKPWVIVCVPTFLYDRWLDLTRTRKVWLGGSALVDVLITACMVSIVGNLTSKNICVLTFFPAAFSSPFQNFFHSHQLAYTKTHYLDNRDCDGYWNRSYYRGNSIRRVSG